MREMLNARAPFYILQSIQKPCSYERLQPRLEGHLDAVNLPYNFAVVTDEANGCVNHYIVEHEARRVVGLDLDFAPRR